MQIFISLQKFKIPHIKTHIRVYMSSMVTYVNMLQLLWKKNPPNLTWFNKITKDYSSSFNFSSCFWNLNLQSRCQLTSSLQADCTEEMNQQYHVLSMLVLIMLQTIWQRCKQSLCSTTFWKWKNTQHENLMHSLSNNVSLI